MSRHRPLVAIQQMRDTAEQTLKFGFGLSAEEIAADEILSLALTRSLSLIGEAANRRPKDVQARYAQIPWGELVALRNVLIHQYDRVNYAVMADIINNELPALVTELNAIIEQESP
jgi:uncharacterized protein with HEPN domain